VISSSFHRPYIAGITATVQATLELTSHGLLYNSIQRRPSPLGGWRHAAACVARPAALASLLLVCSTWAVQWAWQRCWSLLAALGAHALDAPHRPTGAAAALALDPCRGSPIHSCSCRSSRFYCSCIRGSCLGRLRCCRHAGRPALAPALGTALGAALGAGSWSRRFASYNPSCINASGIGYCWSNIQYRITGITAWYVT
jgi:hypothetical protein